MGPTHLCLLLPASTRGGGVHPRQSGLARLAEGSPRWSGLARSAEALAHGGAASLAAEALARSASLAPVLAGDRARTASLAPVLAADETRVVPQWEFHSRFTVLETLPSSCRGDETNPFSLLFVSCKKVRSADVAP